MRTESMCRRCGVERRSGIDRRTKYKNKAIEWFCSWLECNLEKIILGRKRRCVSRRTGKERRKDAQI